MATIQSIRHPAPLEDNLLKMEKRYFTTIHNSPVGNLLLTANGEALTGLYFYGKDGSYITRKKTNHTEKNDFPIFQEVKNQLEEYFAGKRKQFDLTLKFHGTDFQQKVWNTLFTVPFGETATYLQIAEQIGNPKAVRAVGLTNGKNPISIICPCHRVIGSNGKLTGYGGGLENKQWLLEHEEVNSFGTQQKLF